MTAYLARALADVVLKLEENQAAIEAARAIAEAAERSQAEPRLPEKGERGPAPAHRWQGTALQFQQPDGTWGKLVDLLGPPGVGRRGVGVQTAVVNDDGDLILTLTDGTEINAGTVMSAQPYTEAVYLQDKQSNGVVLVFAFEEPVSQVWIELLADSADDMSVGRARVDGQDPESDIGSPLVAGRPQPARGSISEVRVLAPAGKRVAVHGYR